MSSKTYAFLNLGRDKDPRTSTRRIDRRILSKVRDNVPSTRSVVFFCEINEGDDNNELALIREMFKGWRLYCTETREPAALSPDLPPAREYVKWLKDTAVPKWSPQRSLGRIHLPDGETLLCCHRAAGANGQGDRPKGARGPLQRSWDITAGAQADTQRLLHRRGRNVTWLQDVNHYALPLVGIRNDHERTIVHRATDYGRVWAAPGYRAAFKALPAVDMGLDSHDLLRMRGGYVWGGGER